jgi:hypothetical protein
MSDENTNSDSPPTKIVRRLAVTEERKAAYIAALRATGSHFFASVAASPYPNDVDGHRPSGYSTFLKLRRTDSEFSAACDEALAEAVGRAEQELSRRMYVPSERPVLDRQGRVAAVATDWRNADVLLTKFLSRHRPEWVDQQKRQVESNVNVNHAAAGASHAGAAYVISSEVLSMLTDSDKLALGEIMCRAEEKRLELEQQKKQLEGPKDA